MCTAEDEREVDRMFSDTLPIVLKKNGVWQLAIPIVFMGGKHTISSMSTYEIPKGKGFLIGFDQICEDPADLLYSFTTTLDGRWNSYNRASERLRNIFLYLAAIIDHLDVLYPEMDIDLDDIDAAVILDIPKEVVDNKVIVDEMTDKEDYHVV